MKLGRAVFRAKDYWSRSQRLRGAAAALICLVSLGVFLALTGKQYPVGEWLFWRIARLWLYGALESVASVSVGYLLLTRVGKVVDRSPLETIYLAATVGWVAICLAMYAGGFFGLYNPVFAISLAVVGIAAGAVPLGKAVRDWYRQARATAASSPSPLSRLIRASTLAFGVVALLFVYLQVMTPRAINFDASWCHLTIPQDFVRHGRIVPFPADYARAVPHLASILHTWGWLMPGLSTPERWMMALHEEFFILLWTLAGVAACTQWLAGLRVPHAWVAFFLFPSIFVYDMNLGGAADHYVAFFAPAIFLSVGRLAKTFAPADAALLGIAAAGGMLTKYQVVYLLAPATAVLLAATVYWAIRWRGSGDSRGPALRRCVTSSLLGFGVFCVVVAPHFVKNAVFYHNPVYPFMQDVFTHSTPHVKDGALLVDELFKDKLGVPTGTLWEKVRSSAALVVTFPFEPHYSFTRDAPNFGPLFVLTLPLLLFVKRPGRIWIGAALGVGYVLAWAMTFRVDRNLQPVVPIMASVTAALLVAAWDLGWFARAGVVGLVALNVIWAGDAWFYSGYERIDASMTVIRQGYAGQIKQRFNFRSEFTRVNARVPPDGKIVLHDARMSLGINRDILMDWPGQQGLISYRTVRGPAEMFEYYRSLGVTHLLHEPARRPAETVQDDVLFTGFVHLYGRSLGRYGAYQLTALPAAAPPPDPTPYWVLSYAVPPYRSGLYRLERMIGYGRFSRQHQSWPTPDEAWPSKSDRIDELLQKASALVVTPQRGSAVLARARAAGFEPAVTYSSSYAIYFRRRETRR